MADEVKKGAVRLTTEKVAASTRFSPFTRMLAIHGKEEGYNYRLVRNNPNSIAYRNELGYEVVTDGPTKPGQKTGSTDSRQVVGQVYVLMRRPMEDHEVHLEYLRQEARRLMVNPMEKFKTEVGKMSKRGLEPIDRTEIWRGTMHESAGESERMEFEEV